MTAHGSIPWGFAPSPPVGKPRDYEVEVSWLSPTLRGWDASLEGGWAWTISVLGEPIALSLGRVFPCPLEAFWSAKEWAKLHDELGYDLRPSWWDVVNG